MHFRKAKKICVPTLPKILNQLPETHFFFIWPKQAEKALGSVCIWADSAKPSLLLADAILSTEFSCTS